MHAELVLDALEQALWSRSGIRGVVHHSDRLNPPISVDSILRATGRSGGRAVGRQRGRFVRQRPCRDDHRALQDRAHKSARSLAAPRSRGIRDARMGRLVQSPSAAGANRERTAGGARGDVLFFNESTADGGLTQTRTSPEKPGRFSHIPPQVLDASASIAVAAGLPAVTMAATAQHTNATASGLLPTRRNARASRDSRMNRPGFSGGLRV
jgi:hypothetical protein